VATSWPWCVGMVGMHDEHVTLGCASPSTVARTSGGSRGKRTTLVLASHWRWLRSAAVRAVLLLCVLMKTPESGLHLCFRYRRVAVAAALH
jgi:hypothetical protein